MIADMSAFALAATLLILAPGPDNLMVMRNTLRSGRRAGWVTAAGTLSGLAVWAAAAAFGLAALVRASHLGYDILRFAGAGYLVWLGLRSLGAGRVRSGQPTGLGEAAGPGQSAVDGSRRRAALAWDGWGRAYLNGLLSNLFNPKVGVFFVAFLPGFIPAGVPEPLFPLALGLWFIIETGTWLAVLAWLTGRGVSLLRRPAVTRLLESLTGIVLIGFGIRLATQAR